MKSSEVAFEQSSFDDCSDASGIGLARTTSNPTAMRFPNLMIPLLALVAAGCAPEPTETEMKALIETEFSAQVAALHAVAQNKSNGSGVAVRSARITKFRKVACFVLRPGFACQYEAEVTTPGRHRVVNEMARFVRGPNGWSIER